MSEQGNSSRQWTEEQRELFEIDASGQLKLKRVAVLADAGSGKTSVLVERVKQLLKLKAPEGAGRGRILCVSFTERSASDLKERLSEHLEVDVHTIHGFCARILREFGSLLGLSPMWRVLDEEENSDLFYRSFEKVYRRSPPTGLDHSADQWFDLCRLGRAARDNVFDGEGGSDGTGAGLDFEDEGAGQFVKAVIQDYEHSKQSRQSFEYADLERLALKLLRIPEVKQVLHTRYRHLFIDEFQDTSELQCAFMDSLIHPSSSLFVVGDHKQSIYRFRGADVAVFERFVEQVGLKRRLSRNFRSHPGIIKAVNDVCQNIIPAYEPMIAGRADTGALCLSTGVNVARHQCDDDAEGVLSLVKDLTFQGVPMEDIVLLLPRMRGNEGLLSRLREKGISISVGAAGGVLSNQSLKALCNLWIWACEPWQRLRAAQVVVDFQDGRSRVDELIAQLRSPLLGQPSSSCEALLEGLNKLFKLNDRLGVYYQQFRLFALHHQSRGLSPSALARQLARLMLEGADVGGLHLLPPPQHVGGAPAATQPQNPQGALRVMTVHGSKGLEFPVVILADLKGRKARVQGAFLKSGSRVFIASRDDEGKLIKSEAFEEARQAEIRAENLESARLLYVAMTRAEKALYLVDRPDEPVSPPKPNAKPKEPAPTWALWSAPFISRAQLDPASSSFVVEKSGSQASLLGAKLMPQSPTYTRARLGVTALAQALSQEAGAGQSPSTPLKHRHQQQQQHQRQSQGANLKTGLTSHTSREDLQNLGTRVHEYLEYGQWDRLRALASEKNLPFDQFWRWLESPDGEAVFGAASASVSYPEFAFEWKSPSGVVTGRIDRLVVWPDRSEAWVIDYKVLMSPRRKEEILAEYRGQLELYAQAVRSLTGFGNTKAFLLDVACSTGNVWHCLFE